MKKQIQITEKTTRSVEIEVPSFYNEYDVRVAVTDYAVIKVWPGGSLISFIYATDKVRYNKAIDELLQYKVKSITEKEFDIAFNNEIKCLTEQYQLSINMVLDPNLQPASEPTTEQVQAVEQEAQEQAMESAEEGGAEG